MNLTHHLEEGINLNFLEDLTTRNTKHPAGYILVLEYIEDQRARIHLEKE